MSRVTVGLLCLVVLVSVGCQSVTGVRGSGVAITETREIGSFDELALSGSGNIKVTIGEATPLTITADDNLLPLIETKVEGGRLSIRPTESINPSTEIVIVLGTPSLKHIRCSGATKLEVHDVKDEPLKIVVSGASTVHADGKTKRFEVTVSGAGDVYAADLKAEEVAITISGSGNAKVHAENKLKATISGSGNITYSGEPAIEQVVSGAGTIRKQR